MPLPAEDLMMFRETVATYLRNAYDEGERRRIVDSPDGWAESHWGAFARLGVLGAGLPAHLGGMDGGGEAHRVIMELFGSALVLEPYLSTVVIGGSFLQHGTFSKAADMVGAIIDGNVRLAYAAAEPRSRYNLAHIETRARRVGSEYILEGCKSVVLSAPLATHLIIIARTSGDTLCPEGISAFIVEADRPGIVRRDFRTLSGGLASEIVLDKVVVPATSMLAPEGEAFPVIERVIDEATVALCSEAVGIMERLHADTLSYTQQRTQFGRTLASNQVLQHRLVDMLIMTTHSSSIVASATASLDKSAAERARMASAAKVYVGKSVRFCGQQSIQLHGGMGMTDELAIGFLFKRAIEIERQFGSIDHHLTRYEQISFQHSLAA